MAYSLNSSGMELSQNSSLISINNSSGLISPTTPQRVGTLIPNRIFVGGIQTSVMEHELRSYFETYGPVKDVKIIKDANGSSKGFGFVTYENEEDAKKVQDTAAKMPDNGLEFKGRRLNVGPAIKKQLPFVQKTFELVSSALPPGSVLYSASGVPYIYHNGIAVFPSSENYAVTQPQASYTAVPVVPQAIYIPAAAATAATTPHHLTAYAQAALIANAAQNQVNSQNQSQAVIQTTNSINNPSNNVLGSHSNFATLANSSTSQTNLSVVNAQTSAAAAAAAQIRYAAAAQYAGAANYIPYLYQTGGAYTPEMVSYAQVAAPQLHPHLSELNQLTDVFPGCAEIEPIQQQLMAAPYGFSISPANLQPPKQCSVNQVPMPPYYTTCSFPSNPIIEHGGPITVNRAVAFGSGTSPSSGNQPMKTATAAPNVTSSAEANFPKQNEPINSPKYQVNLPVEKINLEAVKMERPSAIKSILTRDVPKIRTTRTSSISGCSDSSVPSEPLSQNGNSCEQARINKQKVDVGNFEEKEEHPESPRPTASGRYAQSSVSVDGISPIVYGRGGGDYSGPYGDTFDKWSPNQRSHKVGRFYEHSSRRYAGIRISNSGDGFGTRGMSNQGCRISPTNRPASLPNSPNNQMGYFARNAASRFRSNITNNSPEGRKWRVNVNAGNSAGGNITSSGPKSPRKQHQLQQWQMTTLTGPTNINIAGGPRLASTPQRGKLPQGTIVKTSSGDYIVASGPDCLSDGNITPPATPIQ